MVSVISILYTHNAIFFLVNVSYHLAYLKMCNDWTMPFLNKQVTALVSDYYYNTLHDKNKFQKRSLPVCGGCVSGPIGFCNIYIA